MSNQLYWQTVNVFSSANGAGAFKKENKAHWEFFACSWKWQKSSHKELQKETLLSQILLSDLGFVCFLKKGTQELLKYLRSKIQGMLLSSTSFKGEYCKKLK